MTELSSFLVRSLGKLYFYDKVIMVTIYNKVVLVNALN